MVATIVVVAIIVLVCLYGIRSMKKRVTGETTCCGGGGGTVAEPEKKLEGKKLGEKIVYIEGMHCENCKNSVERQINRIEGASAQVNLKKNLCVVSYDRELNDAEIKRAVEMADFTVTKIEQGV